MQLSQAIILFFAGGIAGTLNAIAGGGSFVSFPALLFVRVPAVEANATNTVALWPGLAASTMAYSKRLNAPPRLLIPLLATSIAGGFAGALLLLKTPQRTFLHIIPWLLLGGTLLFTFGSRIRAITGRTAVVDDLREMSWRAITLTSIVALPVAVYGGYFGAGIGFLMLAMLAALRFFRRARAQVLPNFTPGVSVLKPVLGVDFASHENFSSFCLQDYPEYEILFAVNGDADPAVPLIRRIIADFPERKIRLLVGAEHLGANRKVNKLARLSREARHELLVLTDGDVRGDFP